MYNDFFKQIDTEEKAYWLGFIAADGNVNQELTTCTIDLQRADRAHVEKFAKCFDNYYKVVDHEREHPSSYIHVYSKQCCLDLMQYGIVPNKSLILDVKTELIPDHLIRHYIRGYFDGDGSIFCSHPNRENGYNYDEWGMNFAGTEKVLTFFKEYLKLNHPVRSKGTWYSLDISGTLETYEILSYLYKDATIYLDRKKEKFEELRSSQRLSKLVSRRDYFAEEKETSILVGFILGGGSIRKLTVEKNSKDKESLERVKEIFDRHNYKTELREEKTSSGIRYNLIVQISPEVAKHYKHHFYPNGNKTVTRHLLNELNNEAIFIWLTLNSHEVDGGLALGTLKFTLEENEIIQNYFKVVHGLDTRIRKQRDKVYIYLTKQSKEALLPKVYVPRGTIE